MNSPIILSSYLLYVLLGTSAFKKCLSYPVLISACLDSLSALMRLFLNVPTDEDIPGSAVHRVRAPLRLHGPPRAQAAAMFYLNLSCILLLFLLFTSHSSC